MHQESPRPSEIVIPFWSFSYNLPTVSHTIFKQRLRILSILAYMLNLGLVHILGLGVGVCGGGGGVGVLYVREELWGGLCEWVLYIIFILSLAGTRAGLPDYIQDPN